jgi:type IV secretion system protein VirB8
MSLFGKKEHQDKLRKSKFHNWYYDRYIVVTIQRNFMSLLVLISALCIFVGLIYINKISQYKAIEPFIVEIEAKTGIPTVVDQVSVQKYTAEEVIQEYFIYTYIRAREGYDFRTYYHDYNTVVRLLSDPGIYLSFRNTISQRNPQSPVNLYARDVRLVPVIKSMQDIDGAKQIRLLVKHMRGNSVVAEDNKVIYIKYRFANLNINLEERLVNPLGFRVFEYRSTMEFTPK